MWRFDVPPSPRPQLFLLPPFSGSPSHPGIRWSRRRRRVEEGEGNEEEMRSTDVVIVEDSSDRQPPHRRMPSWASTLVAQACLGLALYATLSVWIPRARYSASGRYREGLAGGRRSFHDVYFLSVRGGYRPPLEQARLLQQMDVAVRTLNAKFVVDVSEDGERDALLQNATRNYPSLRIPWYATTTSASMDEGIYHKEIIASHERNLDIIVLNTGLWQDVKHMKIASKSDGDQMTWLTRTLAMSRSHWRIIAGFHPLTSCDEEPSGTEILKYHDYIHGVFMRHRVNIYLSKLGCAGHLSQQYGVTHIGNPSYSAEGFRETSRHTDTSREMGNIFLIHRVSPLEIESYFVNSFGDTISRHTLSQWGREAM